MSYERDARWSDLAKILVDYSTEVQADDRVLIIMRETHTFPLAREVYRLSVERGAYPQTLFSSTLFDRDKLLSSSEAQIDRGTGLFLKAMEWATVCIDLRGAANLFELAGIDTDLVARHRRAEGVVSRLRTETTRWVLVRVPDSTLAQQAQISSDEAFGVFFDSCLRDWHAETERLGEFARRLTGTHQVRILSENSDLSFSTEDRKYIADSGRINMPGGELYTSPIESSAEGHIVFEHPGVFAGLLMEDIRLEFHEGRIVSASSRTNADFLRQIIDMDDGARLIGEFGIGTNEGLTVFSNDILFDEKICGTVHIALGRSYKECGGQNDSALHWDIVKDLRAGGQLLIDGRPVIENGRLEV